jgi:hypothetical protein
MTQNLILLKPRKLLRLKFYNLKMIENKKRSKSNKRSQLIDLDQRKDLKSSRILIIRVP